MKRQVLTLALWAALLPTLFSQLSYHETYGQLPNDLNQSNAILQIDAQTFVMGGQWNGVGFMIKVNHKGSIIDYFFLDNTIPGNSSIVDMEFDPAGNIIAVGECDHCVQGDTTKRIFSVATEPSLLLINSEIYDGTDPNNPQILSPSLTTKGNQLVLAATTGGVGLNFQDVAAFSITANLDVDWNKTFNSCSNCGFEQLLDITATNSGFAFLVQNAFTDSLTLYHIDNAGEIIWQRRHLVSDGTAYNNLAYRNGVIFASGTEVSGNESGGFIQRFSESNGSILGSLPIDLPGMADEVAQLHFTNDGTLLAVHRRSQPNSFGTYKVSRIYRVNAGTNQIIDFTEIPNPDVLTGIIARDIVPITDDGLEFSICGAQGLFDLLSFYFSKNSEEPAPPGAIFEATPDTACSPATIVLSNNLPGATTYSWTLDGTEFSTDQNPDPLMLTGAGFHEIALEATTVSQNAITNFVVHNLPEIWNECPICDNKPDPYIKIKSLAGATLYTSGWNENYPPVSLNVSFSMSTSETYIIEVWDHDAVGSDDYFGEFTIPGNTNGGNFNYINSEDPSNPLVISFNTIPTLSTQSHSQTILVYEPSIIQMPNGVLQASPDSPSPTFFTWQWYLNGLPIPGAVADNYIPTIGGDYAVAIVTLDCSALSNIIAVTATFTDVELAATNPLCAGDSTGSITINTIGGTPPFIYEWNNPLADGASPENLPAGNYEVTVTDAVGQQHAASATLTEPTTISYDLMIEDPACAGDTTGAITINATGGTGMLNYEWDVAGTAGDSPTGLAAGVYTVTITDENGCTTAATAELIEPDPLTATMSSTPAINNQSDGTATVTPTGGTPPYFYEWGIDPPQDTPTATGLDAGTYTVIVVDANGCAIAVQVTVEMIVNTDDRSETKWTIYPNPTTGFVFIENKRFVKGIVSAQVLTSNGQLIQKLNLNSSNTTIDLSGLSDGTYFLVLENEDGKIVERIVLAK